MACIENLLNPLGATITEGSGSGIRVKLNEVSAVSHRPHPEKVTDEGAVNSNKKFLENAGVKYDGVEGLYRNRGIRLGCKNISW